MSVKATPTKSTSLNKTNQLPTFGWGPFRYEWYSICSGHSTNTDGNYYFFDVDCPRCVCGRWINCWLHVVGSLVHDHAYTIWYWGANRKWHKRGLW